VTRLFRKISIPAKYGYLFEKLKRSKKEVEVKRKYEIAEKK
jgi:hypothetical protein